MILTPNVTRCPACGRLVYATEPLYVASNWKGVERLAPFAPGIYHDSCFLASPHHEAYLALDRAVQNAELDQPGEYLSVLARTPEWALTVRPYTSDFQLRVLAYGRTLRFRGVPRWQQFFALVIGPGTPSPDVRVRQTRDGWELSTRQSVPISVAFTRADYDRLHRHLSGRTAVPTRTPTELGAVCRQLGITPSSAGCPLDHLIGTFSWPEVPTGGSVTLSVQVETWNRVVLSDAEMTSLRTFLQQLNRPAG